MRKKHWNSWNLVHGFPKVEYVDGEQFAVAHYGGLTKKLIARFRPERQPKCLPDRLMVSGFAARFPKGRKLWHADVDFVRNQGTAEWEFYEVYVFDGPLSSAPPNIIGFLEDYPARERGVGGLARECVMDRARAGRPDGPNNAWEVGRWWPSRPPPSAY